MEKIMMTEPKIETRPAQPYLAIRSQVPISQLGETIRTGIDEVYAWLGKHGIQGAGGPFIRWNIINMEKTVDVEVGVTVPTATTGADRMQAGVLPAGRYASLIYTGIENGIQGNAALLDWGAKQGLVWDTFTSPHGDGFGSRVEFFLSGPKDDPDSSKWDTEVAIRLAD